jgi:hypothetical protein
LTPAILDSAEYRTTCAALAGLLPAPVGERLVASGEVILAGLFDGDYEAFLRSPVLGHLDQTARTSPQVAHELRAIATRMMNLGDEVRRRLHVPDPNPKRRR